MSLSVASVLLMSASVPWMVSEVVPPPLTVAAPAAVAEKSPCVSDSVMLKSAFEAEPASARLIAPSGPGFPTPMMADAGAVITGRTLLVAPSTISFANPAPEVLVTIVSVTCTVSPFVGLNEPRSIASLVKKVFAAASVAKFIVPLATVVPPTFVVMLNVRTLRRSR